MVPLGPCAVVYKWIYKMTDQVFTIPANTWSIITTPGEGATFSNPILNTLNLTIDDDLKPPGITEEYQLSFFQFGSTLSLSYAGVFFYINGSSSGDNLSDDWENYIEAIIIEQGGSSVSIPGPNNPNNDEQDDGEIYIYIVSSTKATELHNFFDALDITEESTFTLRDSAPVVTTTDTDSIYRLAASPPSTPTGGTSTENHTPTNWVRTEPSPTGTQNVYRSQRTRTFEDDVFTEATAWGAPTQTQAMLSAPTASAGPRPDG